LIFGLVQSLANWVPYPKFARTRVSPIIAGFPRSGELLLRHPELNNADFIFRLTPFHRHGICNRAV
jgi:hypothetical protein